MRVFHDLQDLPDFRNAVITIGSFDGVHFGHQQLIDKIRFLAQTTQGESVVITFHPHPRLVIYPKDKSLQLITTIDEKIKLLERFGVDNVVVVPFTIEFSQQSADEYIQKFIVDKFHPKYIVVGYDHRFGLNRQGDINYLRYYGRRHGYEVLEIPKREVEDIAVSSTKIRNFLSKGQVGQAAGLLNHFFSLTGTVVRGQQIGSEIGFPTANLEVSSKHKLIPPDGIFAVFVQHKGQRYEGMLYIGTRPTLKDLKDRTIEVNIFDFNKSIYGDKIQLELVAYIRDDMQFENLDGLKAQLAQDKVLAQDALSLAGEALHQQARTVEDKPSVAVVILNYNTRALLEKYLPTVLQSTYPNLKVIVADNGSTDDSASWLHTQYPAVDLIQLPVNYGFAEGYNRAMKGVQADYYVLLNSDVEVPANWLNPLIEEMERDDK
ncbi:MAG: bifunctional riboflavin kinase/FAD synthetase, partial [Phaeodactylibacter sp.]|nr:bifunctional riboflavin kinase/FAD synthetase [Phaeodactylibacter sp.]